MRYNLWKKQRKQAKNLKKHSKGHIFIRVRMKTKKQSVVFVVGKNAKNGMSWG